MPTLDGEDKVVGSLLREDTESGNYTRCFTVLDFSVYKLRLYHEDAEFATELSGYKSTHEINCQYITKVVVALSRPKVLNCFEIGTPNGHFFFSVDSKEERDEWVESIKKSSLRQSAKPAIASRPTKEISYQTKVVGGVVHRIPIVSSENASSDIERRDGVLGGATATPGELHSVHRRTRGYPRIIKAGHAIKLGAVMKNWKKRFFVLSEISLGYYKSIEEAEPIKSIAVGEIASVAPSREITGKEHLFEVVTPSRTFYVQVDSEEDMEDWVRSCQDLLSTLKIQQKTLTTTAADLTLEDSDDEPGTLV